MTSLFRVNRRFFYRLFIGVFLLLLLCPLFSMADSSVLTRLYSDASPHEISEDVDWNYDEILEKDPTKGMLPDLGGSRLKLSFNKSKDDPVTMIRLDSKEDDSGLFYYRQVLTQSEKEGASQVPDSVIPELSISSINNVPFITDKGNKLVVSMKANSGAFKAKKYLGPIVNSSKLWFFRDVFRNHPEKLDVSKGVSLTVCPNGEGAVMGWSSTGGAIKFTYFDQVEHTLHPKGTAEGCPDSGGGEIVAVCTGGARVTGFWKGSNGHLMMGHFKYQEGKFKRANRSEAVTNIGGNPWFASSIGDIVVLVKNSPSFFSDSVDANFYLNGSKIGSRTLMEDGKAKAMIAVPHQSPEGTKFIIEMDKGFLLEANMSLTKN